MPRPRAGASSLGHLPAHRRHAVPTREHQSGGTPIHAAPTRPAPPPAAAGPRRGEPVPVLRACATAPSTSTSFVLAALRALHVDLAAPGRGLSKDRKQHWVDVDRPFHIRRSSGSDTDSATSPTTGCDYCCTAESTGKLLPPPR